MATITADDLIATSIGDNTIARVPYTQALHEGLIVLCTDATEDVRHRQCDTPYNDYWGTTADGRDWRVQLTDVPAAERSGS